MKIRLRNTMDTQTTRTCFLLLILSLIAWVDATDIRSTNDTESVERQPRVSGRIVKLYSGTRPEPIYCPQEGFQPDPADCAVFYRCVKGANDKFTVFRFQCGPGTVYDPETEVCNFPRSTKRSECGGIIQPSTDKNDENEIEGMRPELPSPINSRPIYSEAIKESSTHSSYPWVTPKPEQTKNPTTTYPWTNAAPNQESTTKSTAPQLPPSRENNNECTKDGFMGDSENCRKFYRCVGNQKGGFIRYEFSCSETTVWDDNAQSCNHPWAVQRSHCGRNDFETNTNSPSTIIQSSNHQTTPGTTIQEQLQINYGDKVTQTQTQISHGQVKQNQTQINYGNRNDKKQSSKAKQNQTQISHGSAISQTQTQINYGNGVQTQLQVDHTKESSQAQAQTYETTSKKVTAGIKDEQEQGYGIQSSTQSNEQNGINSNECTESGFMGDKNDCKKFYRCVDNGKKGYIRYEFSCGEGTVWDSSIEACNHAWAVKECGENAPQNTPESTSHPTSTTKSTPSSQSTSELTTIDESEDTGYGNQNQQPQMTSTTTTVQPNPSTSTSSGDSSSDGITCTSSGFKGDPNNCNKFYRCVDNGKGSYTKYEYNCGEGTVWDPDIEACNHPWAVKNCGGTAFDVNKVETTTAPTSAVTVSLEKTTTQATSENVDYDSGYGQQPSESYSTTTTTKQPQSNKGNKCTSSGFMGDTNDCKKFYRCVDNGNAGYTRYEFSCGEGTVWDPKIEACNHAWAVEKCGGDNSEDIYKETTSARPTMSDEEVSPSSELQTGYPTQPSATTTSSTEQPISIVRPSSGKECSQEGFMGDDKDCKKFYRCVDNGRGGFIKYDFNCGEGTVWDSEINACNHPNSVKSFCSSSNSNQGESTSENPQDFTTEQGSQTSASQSTEQPKTTYKPSTSKPSSGKDCSQEGFMGDESNCKKFYRCVDDGKGGFTKYEFSCGEGTVWDSEINACNHPSSDKRCDTSGTPSSNQQETTEPNRENDEMPTESTNSTESSIDQSQTTSSPQRPTGLSEPDLSSDKCTSEGFYGDSKNCKKFYRCVDNGKGDYTKYEFTCGDGTVWDQEIQACNHESNDLKCSKDLQTNKPQTESNKEDTSISPSNTEEQQSTQKPQTPPSESSSNCTSEGFYANPDDCKKFYRCVDNGNGGYTKYDFSCGDGTMWVQEIQACDHDTGESCSPKVGVLSTTESAIEQQSSTLSANNTTTSNQQPDTQEDESPNEISSEPASSGSSESADKCTGEGFYPNKKDCKNFYRCVDNGNGGYTKYDFACGEGTAWDSNIQSCNHISEVKNCQGQEQESGLSMQDEEVTQSSESTQTSTSGPVTESSKPTSKDTCEQEGYYGNSQDCTKFYRCVDNDKGGFTKYDFTCGEGTIWDQDITACNHPQDVTNPSCQQSDNSDSSTSSSSTTSSFSSSSSSGTTSSTTESSSSNCSQDSTKKPDNKNVNCTKAGYYPDPNDCKKFYRCVDWDGDGKRFSVYHFDCGEGTIWDPALDTCNHEDSVYPPRDCSGGTQSQGENVDQENSTTESTSTTTDSGTTQESQTTTQESTTSEHTTTEQTTTSAQSTTEQTTTAEQTTQHSTTNEYTTTQHTTEQSTEEQTTTQQTTTSGQTTSQQTTSEHTTTEQTTTQESTTQQLDSTEHTTLTTESDQPSTTQQTTDTQKTTTESTTTDGTTTEGTTTEVTTTESTTTEGTATESTTTESSTTEGTTTESTTTESTTEQSTASQTDSGTTESSTTTTSQENDSSTQESTTESSGDQTTESSSTDKECPKSEDDQNLFVCPTSFKRHPKYCNMFYQCTEDDDTHDVQIASFHCPNNTIYDESKTQCVEEKKADKKCNGEMAQKRRLKRLDTVYKEPIVVTNERLKCPAPGHYPFEKGECSPAFLKCQKTKFGKIRGYVYQCPEDYIYWSVSRRCEQKSHVRDCKKSHNDWKGRWEIPIERRNVAP